MDPWGIHIVTPRPGSVTTSAGYSIDVQYGLDLVADADIVVMPWWIDPECAGPELVLDSLRVAYDRGAHIVGLCLGVFVVADAGLLSGQQATTHWKWASTFRRRFPDVKLRSEALYVHAGQVITGAGATAAVDTCLYVLAQRAGQSVANQVARRIVAAPHRPGGQAQYIESPLPPPTNDAIACTMAWAAGALHSQLTIDTLAAHACMSRSSFTRAFRARLGTSVHQWLVGQRIGLARSLLETTELGVDEIARRTGFMGAHRLRTHFRAALGTTPTRYRSDFAMADLSPAAPAVVLPKTSAL
ncbi:helix-turn-helix domain-containing protein [Mycobacterium sp. MHSD3]|uniref:GlxA family transcriptional regulator n=1 Tax=Mycobacteroides chelonae TaxID=1774 RepID=UPI001D0C2DB3